MSAARAAAPGRRLLVSIAGAFVLLGLGLLRSYAGTHPLRDDVLVRASGEPVTDEHLELARRYAPWILHEVHPDWGRQDLLAPVDFDGNLRGDDNWDRFPGFELVPTVYYAVLETRTHRFLSYHLFHPRDWTGLDLGLHQTHENDGENLQVVVEKASGAVRLLFTQAHYAGVAYANPGSGFAPGRRKPRGPFLLVDDAGVPDPAGTHACVYVESGGHGIHGVPDRRSPVAVGADGAARFEGAGIVLRPARAGEPVAEPALDADASVPYQSVPYQLESTIAKLWPLLARGELSGEGRLLDGPLPFACERLRVDVPRFYEGDRFSGPLGPDRGISPFAVSFRFGAGDLGSLFFDPATRYADELVVPRPWSLVYTVDPLATKP